MNISVSNNKSPCGILSRNVQITSPTLYPLAITVHVANDKILLIKQNIISIRGQSFCDDVFFHLNEYYHLTFLTLFLSIVFANLIDISLIARYCYE